MAVYGWTSRQQPNGVSCSRCSFFRITFRKESELWWFWTDCHEIWHFTRRPTSVSLPILTYSVVPAYFPHGTCFSVMLSMTNIRASTSDITKLPIIISNIIFKKHPNLRIIPSPRHCEDQPSTLSRKLHKFQAWKTKIATVFHFVPRVAFYMSTSAVNSGLLTWLQWRIKGRLLASKEKLKWYDKYRME